MGGEGLDFVTDMPSLACHSRLTKLPEVKQYCKHNHDEHNLGVTEFIQNATRDKVKVVDNPTKDSPSSNPSHITLLQLGGWRLQHSTQKTWCECCSSCKEAAHAGPFVSREEEGLLVSPMTAAAPPPQAEYTICHHIHCYVHWTPRRTTCSTSELHHRTQISEPVWTKHQNSVSCDI